MKRILVILLLSLLISPCIATTIRNVSGGTGFYYMSCYASIDGCIYENTTTIESDYTTEIATKLDRIETLLEKQNELLERQNIILEKIYNVINSWWG